MEAIFLILLVLVSIATSTTSLLQQSQWRQFKSSHQKSYENAEEELKRIEIFYENLQKIEDHNKLYEQGLVTWQMGVNQFTDWTQEEFIGFLKMSGRVPHKSVGTFVSPINTPKPSAIDWRQKGAVTRVKDQGQCGSCWAFSAVGSLEGQNALKTGKLIALSAQELVDCSYENMGCLGGSMDLAFRYVEANGLASEDTYGEGDGLGHCLRDGKPRAVHCHGYHDIEKGNETDLEAAVAFVGPVSVTVDATYWSCYGSGIFQDCSPYDLNHGVLAVGYGTDDKGQDYWIIKNSWGAKWGEHGYIRVPRHHNKCGIAMMASYPLL